MKFASKGLEKLIVDQLFVIEGIKSNVSKLRNVMPSYVGIGNEIIWEALFEKYYELEIKQLPVEELKLSKLYIQNEKAFSNRSNRRDDLIGSMFTVERKIPA